MLAAQDALQRLKEGNQRFVSEMRNSDALNSQTRRCRLVDSQEPFAIILGCSDSRVPAEIVFDQGLGDLFVIRVAGNIVAPSQIGSVEFAVEQFGTGLVIVLGHSRCGAVRACIEEINSPSHDTSRNISSIVNRIRPSISTLIESSSADSEQLINHAVRANIRASVNQLSHGSTFVEQLIEQNKLMVIGAEYSLDTGVVEFFDF